MKLKKNIIIMILYAVSINLCAQKTLTLNVGHSSFIKEFQFCPNNELIATASYDKTIKIWDIKTGVLLKTFDISVNKLRFSDNGKAIVYLDNMGIHSIEIDSGIQKTIERNTKEYSISKYFENDQEGKISDIKRNEILNNLKIKNLDNVIKNSIKLNKNESMIGIISLDGLSIYDTNSKSLIMKTAKGVVGNSAIAFSSDEKLFAIAKQDSTVQLFDAKNGKIKNIVKTNFNIERVYFAPKNTFILLVGINKISRYVIESDELHTSSIQFNHLRSVEFSSNGNFIVFNESFHCILWDIASGQIKGKYEINNNSYKNKVRISVDSRFLVFAKKNNIFYYNLETGKESKRIKNSWEVQNVDLSPNNKYLLTARTGDKKYNSTVILRDFNSGDIIREFNNPNAMFPIKASFVDNQTILVFWMSSYNNYLFEWFNIDDGRSIKRSKLVSEDFFLGSVLSPDNKTIIYQRNTSNTYWFNFSNGKSTKVADDVFFNLNGVNYSNDGKYITYSRPDGSLVLFDAHSHTKLLTLYNLPNSKDYIHLAPNGSFDGTEEGIKQLHFVEDMSIVPLSSFYEEFFTPNLYKRLMGGESFSTSIYKMEDLKKPPTVEIISPKHNSKFTHKTVTVSATIIDMGGGIDEIRIFHNDKLINSNVRGFKKLDTDDKSEDVSVELNLINGINKITVIAFNSDRVESIPAEVVLRYVSNETIKPNLNLFIIGINNYKNPKYKLNYALADASGFKTTVTSQSNSIFNSVNTIFLDDIKVTRENITQEFEKLKQNTKAEDVFIFYYAGHGVMSEEEKSQFYLLPYDVTQMYGNNELLKTKGISASELKSFSKEIKAQKQLFILDACQSGGMTELMVSRGAAEEKAIAQLARSTGTYWLTASGSDQFATEFERLGHGVFTYSVIEGLKGAADGGSKDKKITVNELSSYINDKVPELTEKFKGQAQYPTSYGYGQDFPIVIIKE